VASTSKSHISTEEVIDLTLSDDDEDNSFGVSQLTSIYLCKASNILIRIDSKTAKPTLKVDTSRLTNELVSVKTELDSSLSSESLPTPNHLLEYIYNRSDKLKV
jgi:hypothetical protein